MKAVRILYAATLLPEHTQHQPFSGPENGFSQTITLLYLSQWHTEHNGSISTTIEIDTFFSQRKRDTYCNILLHDHFEGCIEIANPEGSFSSQGAKPRGMKNEPKGFAISMHPKK